MKLTIFSVYRKKVVLALAWELEVQFKLRSEIWLLDKAVELQLEDNKSYDYNAQPTGFSFKNTLTCCQYCLTKKLCCKYKCAIVAFILLVSLVG